MSGYAKLFASIVESSIWDEDSDTCKVWVTLLALADSEGFIRGSPGWLSKRARVNVDTVDKALTKFQSPDPFSRTPDKDGRRLESTPDGWVIINYAYYRDQDGKELSKDTRRTYQREWMRRKRAELKAAECQHLSTGVNACQPSASASASFSQEKEGVQGKEEVTFDQAMATVPIDLKEQIALSPRKGFPEMVFDDWDSRDGRDAANSTVRFSKYLRKRWNKEGEEWSNGCHRAQRKAKNISPLKALADKELTPAEIAAIKEKEYQDGLARARARQQL